MCFIMGARMDKDWISTLRDSSTLFLGMRAGVLALKLSNYCGTLGFEVEETLIAM